MSFHDDQPTGQTPEDGSLAASRADSSAHALSVQKKPYKTITTPTVEQVLSGLKGPRPSTLSQGSFGTLDPKEENTLFLYIQSNLSQESFDFDSVEGECREFLEGLSSLPPLGRVRVVTERLWRGRSVYMVQVAELLAVNSRDGEFVAPSPQNLKRWLDTDLSSVTARTVRTSWNLGFLP